MSSRASRPRPSRKQRLAAGAVLATTGLLGTYLAALRPQPTYASPSQGVTQAGNVTTAALTIPTCADAGAVTVTTDTELRDAITGSTDDSIICVDGLITLTAALPAIDDTSVTLVGDDSTLDGISGADAHQILTANFTGDDTLIVSNLTLRNGLTNTKAGGAIDFNGAASSTLVIDNATLANNEAATGQRGGAVSAEGVGASLVIQDSVFDANTTQSGLGGAIATDDGLAGVFIENSTFTSNRSLNEGAGAIYAQVPLTIRSSLFGGLDDTNTADEAGGAISFSGDDTLSIYDSTFTSNASQGDGGAISISAGNSALKIDGSTFEYNTADGSGGAIYANNISSASLNNSNFFENRANGGGGAAYIYADTQDTNVRISSTTIESNIAHTGNGGGVLVSRSSDGDAAQLVVEKSNFNGNKAYDGNGGGIYSNTATTIRYSEISGNLAQGSSNGKGGGLGLATQDDSILIANSSIFGNFSKVSAGGIFVPADSSPGTALTLVNSTVSDNRTSSGYSTAMHAYGSNLTVAIDYVTFALNKRQATSADDSTNAVNLTGSGTIHNSIFNNVGVAGQPFDLVTDGSTFDVSHSVFTNDSSLLLSAGTRTSLTLGDADLQGVSGNNGGPTVGWDGAPVGMSTQVVPGNSIAVGAADSSLSPGITNDQRGVGFPRTNQTVGALNGGTPTTPTIAGISPSSGPEAGGTSVTITGTNLTWVTDVTFGGVAATFTEVVGGIEVTTPPGSAGAVDVAVTSDRSGQPETGKLVDGFTYTAAPTPTPTPAIPPSAPADATAEVTGESSVDISWEPPASSGSFPITTYQATAAPGGQTCLVAAPALTCTITGLTPGTTYTASVRALNGAGWGATTTTDAFTPGASASIMITGERDTVRGRNGVRADGVTTGLVGATVQARVKLAGEVTYRPGSTRTVSAEGDFTWQRRANKKVYVYFTDNNGTRSNRIIIPR